MVIEKNVSCEKKAKKDKYLQEKWEIIHTEKDTVKKFSKKIWSSKEYYFNEDEIQSFPLRFENFFSKERLFASKQTKIIVF